MKTFFNTAETARLKSEKFITDYLAVKGYEPVLKSGCEWLYQSIGTNEKTPSFFVNHRKNVYYDFSGNAAANGTGGDIIRLVMHLENVDFVGACNMLAAGVFSAAPHTPQQEKNDPETSKLAITRIGAIKHPALINYIESRKIIFSIADMYCREVYYKVNDNIFYAVGFPNDNGGFALRSAKFKSQTKPNGYTSLSGLQNDTKQLNIFEGFFDFLSCLTFYKTFRTYNHSIVLNSLNNLNSLIPRISETINRVNVFFDDDKTGRAAVEKLQKLNAFEVVNLSEYYGAKDFNEMLVNNVYTNQ